MKLSGACLHVLHRFAIFVVGLLPMSDEHKGFGLVSE